MTLVTDRTAEEIRAGSVMSSQVTFESALEAEAALGVPALLPAAPTIRRMAFELRSADGASGGFDVVLPWPARSVDLRVKEGPLELIGEAFVGEALAGLGGGGSGRTSDRWARRCARGAPGGS